MVWPFERVMRTKAATASAVAGFTVNHQHLQANLALNPSLGTALNARIGYDAAAAIMQRDEFRISVSVGDGPGKAIFWTSDLSHDYVSINADYRT